MQKENAILTSPLAGGARRTGKSEGYIKENNLIIFPSSVCADSVRQTTSPALGGSHTANSGFTLIELLVVVLIIGILAAAALPQYQKAVLKSRVTQVVAYLKAVKNAEEVYYLANGEYTADMESLSVEGTCPKNWTCQLMADNNIPKVEAGYDSWKLAVVSSFDHRTDVPAWAGIMYCFARTGNPKYDQACKSMGAPIPDGVTSGGTRYYIGK